MLARNRITILIAAALFAGGAASLDAQTAGDGPAEVATLAAVFHSGFDRAHPREARTGGEALDDGASKDPVGLAAVPTVRVLEPTLLVGESLRPTPPSYETRLADSYVPVARGGNRAGVPWIIAGAALIVGGAIVDGDAGTLLMVGGVGMTAYGLFVYF